MAVISITWNGLGSIAFTFPVPAGTTNTKPSMRVASELRPDIIVLGNDWQHEAPLWAKYNQDSLIAVCPQPWRESTTNIIHRIRSGHSCINSLQPDQNQL
jgi:hypothetical protein